MVEGIPDFIRGTAVILAHSLTMYVLSTPSVRNRHPARFWTMVSLVLIAVIIPLIFIPSLYPYSSGLMFILFACAFSIAFIYASSGPALRNLFLFFMYGTYFMMASVTSDFLASVLFPSSNRILIVLAIRSFLSLIFLVLFIVKLRSLVMDAINGIYEGWGALAGFSIVACLFVSALIPVMSMTSGPGLHLLLLLMTFFFVTAAFIVVIRSIGLLNDRNEIRALRNRQEILEHELAVENKYVDTARSYRHDMRHHVAVLQSYVDAGDTESLRKYLNEAEGEIDRAVLPVWCANSTVNSLLRITSRRCQQKNIRYSFHVDIPEKISLTGPELGIIFGNLLENASENTPENGELEVEASVRNRLLFAEIRNTVSGGIVWNDDLPRSTKKGGGIGLKSVKSTAEAHDGLLQCLVDGGRFIVRITVPLQ